MNDYKYILIVFNDFGEEMARLPKEVNIIKKVATAEVRGASCGPLNLSFFTSDRTREEISDMFKKDKIDFILFEEKDSSSSLPSYITKMFGKEFEKYSMDISKEVSKDKLSLEDQLKEAVANEEFAIAARLRDKIAQQSKKVETTPDSLKTLFKNIG